LATHAVCYRSHHVEDYLYDFVFCNGEVAKVCAYDNKNQIPLHEDELKAHNKRFGIKEGYLLALPKNKGKNVVVKKT